MADTSLITESLSLMAIGMGIVFSFLVLLVVLLRVMSWFSAKLAPGQSEAVPSFVATPAAADAATEELIAVIGVAINRYRSGMR